MNIIFIFWYRQYSIFEDNLNRVKFDSKNIEEDKWSMAVHMCVYVRVRVRVSYTISYYTFRTEFYS